MKKFGKRRRKKLQNKFIAAFITVLLCIAAGILIYLLSRYQHTSAERLPNEYAGQIEFAKSSKDQDDDGIDDQTDILQGALDYVSTTPKYKSRYYEAGYPDDGYGVCTDVVANALRSAGYDLMTLIQEDISRDPEVYGIDEPDINIDFRRVDNLQVYFEHTAICLTTDISEIGEWQGGDIVVFKNHIGVVSDRRNKDGVPYVIHHNDPLQTSYEQDILEKREDITGHFRISE